MHGVDLVAPEIARIISDPSYAGWSPLPCPSFSELAMVANLTRRTKSHKLPVCIHIYIDRETVCV
jgi:hypothetical protein